MRPLRSSSPTGVARQAIERCGGNITAAAKVLGVGRTKLCRDLESLR